MDIDVFPPHELPTVMRVLRTALEPTDALWTRERAFLDTYAHIVGLDLPIATPEPIVAADVHIESRHARKRLVQLAALAVLLNRPVKRAAVFRAGIGARTDSSSSCSWSCTFTTACGSRQGRLPRPGTTIPKQFCGPYTAARSAAWT